MPIAFKKTNKTDLFLPHLFGSQQCEALFRQVRSFTSTYSTVANCSVKEILSRISKIQLQSEIAYNNYESFKFPRLGNSHGHLQSIKCELPTLEEIYKQIEASKGVAIKDALNIGLLKKKQASNSKIYACKVNSIDSKGSIPEKKTMPQHQKPQKTSIAEKSKILLQLHGTLLKNYSDKFENKFIDETSPYTEIFRAKGKRLVVKKTSLCWLLRKDWQKISADRLQRVQANVNGRPKRIFHFDLRKRNITK